jgi:plasmid stabilization system protein ParE
MTISVVVSDDAQQMLREADERWIDEHGVLAENPLFAQVDHAVALLREQPRLGLVVRHRGQLVGEARRLLLRSGWHLYYHFDAEREFIEILAVWFASRGSGPPL